MKKIQTQTRAQEEEPQEQEVQPAPPVNSVRIMQLKASAFDLTNDIERLINIRNQVITELNKELSN
jgi:hypothetical protein